MCFVRTNDRTAYINRQGRVWSAALLKLAESLCVWASDSCYVCSKTSMQIQLIDELHIANVLANRCLCTRSGTCHNISLRLEFWPPDKCISSILSPDQLLRDTMKLLFLGGQVARVCHFHSSLLFTSVHFHFFNFQKPSCCRWKLGYRPQNPPKIKIPERS